MNDAPVRLININGIFVTPDNRPVAGITIRLRTRKYTNRLLQNEEVNCITDRQGGYSLSVLPGDYEAACFYHASEKAQTLGVIHIEPDSPDGTLNDFLGLTAGQSFPPAIMVKIIEWVDLAEYYANEAKAAAESVGFHWQAAGYNDDVTYQPNDALEYLGSGYVCTAETLGNKPDESPECWSMFASKGGDGGPGPANTLEIGTVETLPAGEQATAEITGDAPNQVLNLSLPAGKDGVGGGVALWSSEQTYKSGDIVRVNRSLFLAKTDNQNSQPLTTKSSLAAWDIVMLNEPYTLAIPGVFSTLTEAVTYFAVVSSAAPITFTISGEITDNEIVITNSAVPLFNINAGQLNLGEKNGVVAIGAGVNVAINNTKFVGADSAGGNAWTNNAVAAFAQDGAAITITDITTTNVYYGAQAARASLKGSGCVFTGAGDTGVLAFDGGQIWLSDCASNHAYDAANALGWGYVAEAGASIWLQNCTSTGNVEGGLFANIGGHIRDDNGTHTGNVRGCVVRPGSNIELTASDLSGSDTSNAEVHGGALTSYGAIFSNSSSGHGIYATGAATVHLHGATASNNHGYGIYAEQSSMVKLNSAMTWTGNHSGNTNHTVGTLAPDGALIAN